MPRDDDSAERAYVLDMFPYPSGDLHMGHAEAFVMGDIVSRYLRLKGLDVLHPIGWDSFGLPAENAAIQRGTHPAEWTYANIDTQATSFRRYGLSLDWSRRLHTSDPEYYRWTQWLFLRFRERGLAYRKASFVNWCPKDQTVLANEQVVQGTCERCGTTVTKRQLTQWYFRVTEYAQRLLDDMGELEGGWPDRVLAMQRNWIGRSEGAYVDFAVTLGDGSHRAEPVRVFTTRPDTLYGATFFVVAPEAPLAAELVTDEHRAAFEAYLEQTKRITEIERQATDRPKTGVFLGVHATNPVDGEQIPVFAADYVLAEYGTGAVMAVPAHDQRDLDFARAHGLRRPRRRRHRASPTRPRPGRDAGRRRVRVLGPAGRADRQDGRHRADRRAAAGRRRRRDGGDLPPARLAAEPAALLGRADPDHPLPGLRRGRRSPTTSCPSSCRTSRAPRWRPRAPRRWPAPPTG